MKTDSYCIAGVWFLNSSMYDSEGVLRHSAEFEGSTMNSSHDDIWMPMTWRIERKISLKMEIDIAVFARIMQSTPASAGVG